MGKQKQKQIEHTAGGMRCGGCGMLLMVPKHFNYRETVRRKMVFAEKHAFCLDEATRGPWGL